MYLILFVLHNTDDLEDVLQAWEATGVNGVTILASAGLARLRERSARAMICHSFPACKTFFVTMKS